MNTCGMCETPVEHGYLCPGCTRALADRLQRMPRLYNALGAFLAPAATREPGGGRTGRAEAPLPVCEPVLNLRANGGMVTTLETWRSDLHAARRWAPPTSAVGIPNRVALAAGALLHSVDWIATCWSEASDLAHEIRDLERDIATITGARERPAGLRLGPCPAEHTDGTLCGAILRLQPGEQLVTCRWCATTYPPGTWALLKQLIDHDAQQAAA
ncbi:hypothetical protein OG462_09195 [Streptomyces sp. NBC_01077]|uniref:hypothetical protein n=1 Tax=Streptomyces sp. NBC_01077 TaxID=2903746 RepID=UPI003863B626|nr:hypothetical protein OG462_09195 [Streptomyces sp. NBC_01077]